MLTRQLAFWRVFVREHNYITDQSRCPCIVQSGFLQRGRLGAAGLCEDPFSSIGFNVLDKLFSESKVQELTGLVGQFVA
jgi:hypothetical protein